MKRVMRKPPIWTLPIIALLSLAFVAGTWALDGDFGYVHSDFQAHWILSADSSPCNPEVTGRVCAEWGDSQQMYGISCCVSPGAIGSTDPGACEQLINGHLAFMPDRGDIE